MAQCMNYKTGERCPALHECESESEYITGRKSVSINNQNVTIRTTIVGNGKMSDNGGKEAGGKLERYCFYCMATKRGKKIGNKASWTGSTPKWCPLGRDEV